MLRMKEVCTYVVPMRRWSEWQVSYLSIQGMTNACLDDGSRGCLNVDCSALTGCAALCAALQRAGEGRLCSAGGLQGPAAAVPLLPP